MNEITDLEAKIEAFKEISLTQLKREELGIYSFEQTFEDIQAVYEWLSVFVEKKEFLKNEVSQGSVNSITNWLGQFTQVAKEIVEFDPTKVNPNEVKNNIASRITSIRQGMFNDLLGVFNFLKIESLNIKQASRNIQKQEEEISKALTRVSGLEAEAQATLASIKQAAGSTGATVYSEVFKNQASLHRKIANRWFWGSIVIIFSIIGYLLYLLDQLSKDSFNNSSLPIAIHDVFIKAVLLSVLFYALHQAIRNYNANMHLEVLNQHRQNAIETFEAFANAATTDEVKSAVLMQATSSIFDFNKSGFLTKDNPPPPSFNPADFLKNLGGK